MCPNVHPTEQIRSMILKAESCINAGQLEAAAALYRELLLNEPNAFNLHHILGLVYIELGKLDRAIFHIDRSIHLNPHYADAYRSLGDAYLNSGNADLSLEAYQKALLLNPKDPDTLLNFGNALHHLGAFQEALTAYRRIVDRSPCSLKALNNMAKTFQDMGQLDQALECYNQCLANDPHYAEARFNRATALLSLGQYSSGWHEYEWRFRRRGAHKVYPHRLETPRWQGESYSGSRLLVHCEQGMGDVLQFVRYLPKAKQLGGTLILEAHPPLLPLLEMMECVDETVTFDALRSPTIRHDVHIPLLSLPLLFNSGMDDLSQHNPYLHCDASHVKLWRNHLAFDGLSIGLVWATSGLNQGRDLPLDQCLSWFRIPGITFVGLQKELSADHHKKISQVGPFANFGECFKDFRDTAAVIANLDLVISVDTAVAHLAGAMGKPLWVLLPYSADWRWPLHSTASPWYPNARIFRQVQSGNWHHVISCVSHALTELKDSHSEQIVIANYAEKNPSSYLKEITAKLSPPQGKFLGRKRNTKGKKLFTPTGDRQAHNLYKRPNIREHRIRKVLLISPIYGGSLEVIRYLLSGFRQASYSAVLQDNSKFFGTYSHINSGRYDDQRKDKMTGQLLRTIDQELLASIEQFKPDLILAIAQSPIQKDTVAMFKSKGIASAFWFVEDYRFRPYWSQIAPLYDYFFTIQRNEELNQKFAAMHRTHWHYLPLACDPTVHKPLKPDQSARQPYRCQIGFMGAPYLNRLNVFEELTQWELGIWGEGWDNVNLSPRLKACIKGGRRRISVEESVKIYCCADIIINLHSSPFVKGISPNGDFVNPRTFEIAGCSGFQLCDRRSELPLVFKPDDEIVLFDSITELKELIEFWLSRPTQRKEISLKAQKRAYAEHTYRHRAIEIVRLIEN
jgi:spore maturation protein CgeB/Tfp pilus assembly protein PilF